MYLAGLPEPSDDHTTKIVKVATDINNLIQQVYEQIPEYITPFFCIGINSRPVVKHCFQNGIFL